MANDDRKHLSLSKDKAESLKKTLSLVPKSRSSVKRPQQNFFNSYKRGTSFRIRDKSPRAKTEEAKSKRVIQVVLKGPVSVAELAMRMQEKTSSVIDALEKIGTKVAADEILDLEMSQLVVEELGGICKIITSKYDESNLVKEEEDKEEDLLPRYPVVVVMGHVDHGKTTLLDILRSSNIAKKEAGGITQDIRAFSVDLPKNSKEVRKAVFLDTPGHQAFDGIRSKGVVFADIILLVVAADDSVKPQTIDSISYAKKTNKPIVVAITKCDLEVANPKKVLSDLVQYEVIDESLGGDTLSVEISSLKGKGIDSLLETLWLQVEVLNLRANPKKRARGVVIDSYVEKGRGSSATVLIKAGTLKKGDIVVVGATWGKVRSMRIANGEAVKEAIPGTPVQILGLNNLPQMGDELIAIEKEGDAKALARLRLERSLGETINRKRRAVRTLLDDDEQQKKALFVIKGGVYASLGSLVSSIESMGNEELKVEVLQSDVGEIGEKDVDLARASGAVILGFGTGADVKAKAKATMEGVSIVCDKVIYRLLDKAKELCEKALGTERKEVFLGKCKVIQVFEVDKIGKIAGSEVLEGQIKVGSFARVKRGDKVVCEGEVKNLQVNQGQVKLGKQGMQCGVLMERYENPSLDDIIEVFLVENVQKTLSEA